MKKCLGVAVLFCYATMCCGALGSQALAVDHGFPTLNSAGRYLGMGWSHHTYHSNIDGRWNVLDRRHPASDYPSRALSYPYSPYYSNIRSPNPSIQPINSHRSRPIQSSPSDVSIPRNGRIPQPTLNRYHHR